MSIQQMKWFNITVFVFICQFTSAMEEQRVESEMTIIKKWDDIKPFAGSVIAYKIRGGVLSEAHQEWMADDAYSINSDVTLKFGSLWTPIARWGSSGSVLLDEPKEGYGYNLDKLLKKGSSGGNYPLTDDMIKALSPLLMRIAKVDELNTIRDAIVSDKALFCYANKETTLGLLNKFIEQK